MASIAFRNSSRRLLRAYFSKLGWQANVIWRIAFFNQLQVYPSWLWRSDLFRASLKPLLIRTLADVGKLPAGITVEMPSHYACNFIAKRLAIPVADLKVRPDLTIGEYDLDHALGVA